MKVHGVFLVAVFFYLTHTQLVKGQFQPHEGCQTRCGEVEIKYPFGISSGCYYPGDDNFNITCKEDRPRIGYIEVQNFYPNGQIQVLLNPTINCEGKQNISSNDFTLGNYSISTNNKLTLVGCNALAILVTSGNKLYATVCISACESPTAADAKCDGEGCCTTDISDELNNYLVEVGSTRLQLSNQTSSVHHFDPCVYSFLVEEGKFNFSCPEDLKNLRNGKRFPVVLDWSIGNKTCEEVGNKSICGGNSTCFTSNNRTGYICTCNDGYDGNPYLSNEHRCQADINECTSGKHNCPYRATCSNKVGGFDCKCKSGHRVKLKTLDGL
ncbi:unnamed protein product [Brassica oleracea]